MQTTASYRAKLGPGQNPSAEKRAAPSPPHFATCMHTCIKELWQASNLVQAASWVGLARRARWSGSLVVGGLCEIESCAGTPMLSY